jgi:vacuolar-type H+-ATPase subunit E/Vma4
MGVAAEEKKTEREVAKFEEDLRAGWDDRVEKIRTREVSTARIEARRLLLNARERAVVRVFDEIMSGLGFMREDPGRYRDSLTRLAVEAVRAVGGEGIVLRLSERDRGLADEGFMQAVSDGAGMAAGAGSLRLEFDTADTGGGCVATSADGRVVFDNTFPRRLERMRSELRALIVEELDSGDE